MKTMIQSLLALILCLCLLGTSVLAAEVESNEQDTLSCQVQLTHVSLDPVNDALGYKAQILAELVEKVWPKAATGEVKPTIYKVLPIQEAEAAHDLLYKSQSVGKVVLTVE